VNESWEIETPLPQIYDFQSVIMGPYKSTMLGAAVLFEGDDCQGRSQRYYWNPMDPLGGRYPYEEMGAEVDPTYGVSVKATTRSISVPIGYYAELYTEEKFGGESVTIQRS